MEQSREQLIQIITSTQVVDAKLFNRTRQENPMLAKLMFNKFKKFLVNDTVTDIERQTMLIRFLETQGDFGLVTEIIRYLQTCPLQEDYKEIIMEWTYHNSDLIRKHLLHAVDGVGLADTRQPEGLKLSKPPTVQQESILNDLIQEIVNIAMEQIQEEPPEDDQGGAV